MIENCTEMLSLVSHSVPVVIIGNASEEAAIPTIHPPAVAELFELRLHWQSLA